MRATILSLAMMVNECIVLPLRFPIFPTQLHSCLCNYNVIVFISWQEGSIITGILLATNTPLS